MEVRPSIFRSYDIRGIYREDFDAEFAQKLGGKVTSWLKAGPLVIGRDGRDSSDELVHAVMDGALHAGAGVIDVGHTTSPQFYWAVRTLGAVGGIMVTASHNPKAYNGFKVVARQDDALEVIGGHQLRQVYDSHLHLHRPGGSLRAYDPVPDYAAAVAYAADWTGGQELRLSVEGPQPAIRVLERLAPIAPDHDLAVQFDADADRITFFDRGQSIPPDFIFLLLVKKLELSPVVFEPRFSRVVREELARISVPFILSPVGRLAMTQAMHKEGAMFGGETSGHFYWRSFGGMEAPELTLLQVYRAIQASGSTLAQLVEPYRQYRKSEEITVAVKDRKHALALINQVRRKYSDAKTDTTDGIAVEYPEWWLHLRPSNTEPALRLVVEAKEKDLLDEKVQEVMSLLA
jgi:phosphomannomutase